MISSGCFLSLNFISVFWLYILYFDTSFIKLLNVAWIFVEFVEVSAPRVCLAFFFFFPNLLYYFFPSLYSYCKIHCHYQNVLVIINWKCSKWWHYCPLIWRYQDQYTGIILPQRKQVYHSLNKTFMVLVLKYFGPDFKKQPSRVTFLNYTLNANQSLCRNINILCHHFLLS